MLDTYDGYQLLTFIDSFSGYNQIFMHFEDQEKTFFITEHGTYYYKVMHFGLKNIGATYQRLVTKIFMREIGKSEEVYVDDILTKSLFDEVPIEDLVRAF